jgi:MoaA/NifB/PqqE/SkfB family radical SAM enzyme
MKAEKVLAGVRSMQKLLPQNRLRQHLETCALTYGCPAGKNFFLGRYEAPLPTSGKCNARCLGCLSKQETDAIPISQNRISFTPTPEDIAELSLAHIHRVKQAIVSFGQGCEGDPLLVSDVIESAIRNIRSKTDLGTIHMNTNGSKPDRIKRLLKEGLDSIRISINSVREKCYAAYFRPIDYKFSDVEKSIDYALDDGKFVSVNYLNCPGFNDTHEEFEAFRDFLERHPIHMIQWRNLNFDPVRYWGSMGKVAPSSSPMGVPALLKKIRKAFPQVRFGYFNPPKETFPSKSFS